ncbi:MAG TPA: S1 family peptidase [Micromonosporaceae bacterium]|nr:S1 family peptidase [Micromonosporaceae bacterium]
MIQRRLILLTVALVALAALFSVTVPALATTERPPGSLDTLAFADARPQDPDMAAAMARDLRLTPAQTQARIATERWARRTESRLRSKLGARFGGAWIAENGQELMVAVTDSAATATVRAAGAQPRVVTRSASQLATLKDGLDDSSTPAHNAIRGWYIDVPSNTLVVLAQPAAMKQAEAFIAASGTDPAAVRVVPAPDAVRPLFDVRGGDAYFVNSSARCSVGFSVANGFLTAGHCGPAGSRTTGFNQVAQGTVEQSTFPGRGDFALVEVNQNWTPQPVVAQENRTVPVAGSQEAPVGASVCRTGSTTGTRCGRIQVKNVTVNYPEGAVTGLTQTDVCAEGGDSGGSFISGDQAQGITSGGSGDCTAGGASFFQPVNEILTAVGARLVTNGGGSDAAGQPPTGGAGTPAPPARDAALSCATSSTVFRGSLTGGGANQIQPDGAFYETTAGGRQLGCLDVPGDAEFTLALQRWDGRQFATVARAPAGGGDKTLAVTAAAGFYRWQVTSVRGSGTYSLGVTAG